MVVKLDHKIADLLSKISVILVSLEIPIESLNADRNKVNFKLRGPFFGTSQYFSWLLWPHKHKEQPHSFVWHNERFIQ